ncbi:outer membrane beta-barrel protein, partial [Myxococcota bacterium]|nr:outer membrane beta-barrel protein [Myxococcota bacterium]
MRSICTSVVIAAASMLLVVPFATAADLESEIADMKQRMEAMEDQLQAQNDELTQAQATVKEQTALIENSGLEEREDVSALSKFIEGVDFSAWVAASYNYNFAGSGPGSFSPPNLNYGYDWSSNTFQLDQAWISIDKAPTEESRGGFHMDLQAGALTQTDGYNGGISIAPNVGIYSAYVSYLAPLFNGVQIDAGIMPTIIGWEVEQQNANWNITRGATWSMQPVTNTGVLVTVPIG